MVESWAPALDATRALRLGLRGRELVRRDHPGAHRGRAGRLPPMKVVVVGGGVLGVSTAQQLARSGAEVVLVTEGELASQASGRSLSWLNSAGVRSEHYHRLRMAGIDRYRTLSATHPGLDWLRFDGGLAWRGGGRRAAPPARARAGARLRQPPAHRRPGRPSASPAWTPPPSRRPERSGVPARAGWTCRAWSGSWPRTSSGTAGRLVTDAGPARVVIEAGAGSPASGPSGASRSRRRSSLLATGAAVPGMVAELGAGPSRRQPGRPARRHPSRCRTS